MRLVGQTILRGPDGTRWVVSTLATEPGFVTTARRTGCDLTPVVEERTETAAQAEGVHRGYCAGVKKQGRPTASAPREK